MLKIKKRKKKLKSKKNLMLQKCPQKKGVCLKVFIKTPKKPNSGLRKVVRLQLKNNNQIISYIPGEGHNLQEYSNVLFKGGKIKDLPGVKYRLVRGSLDFLGLKARKTSRSKYGTKKLR